MNIPSRSRRWIMVGVALVVVGVITLSFDGATAPQGGSGADAEQKNEEGFKGQDANSPLATRRFTPIENVKRITQSTLSFMGLPEEELPSNESIKGTFPSIVKTPEEIAAHEQAIFNIVFPPQVLASFRKNQDKMIAAGVLSENMRNPLTTEADAVAFIKNQFSLYLSLKDVSATDKQNAARALERVDDVIAAERLRAERILRGRSAEREPSRILAFLSLSIPVAHATWYTDDPCYKDDDPDSSATGTDLTAICCNCGFYYDGETLEYYSDCTDTTTSVEGGNTDECNIYLGCLNLYCIAYDNAIWDPDTFVCGCG